MRYGCQSCHCTKCSGRSTQSSRRYWHQLTSITQSQRLPLQQVVLIRTSPHSAYANLLNPRGIGPNQAIPAFDYFAEEFVRGMTLTGHDAQLQIRDHGNAWIWLKQLESTSISNLIVVAVIENYPLPGEDFEQQNARHLLAALVEKLSGQLLVVSLKNAYQEISGVTHLVAYGSRECSAVAAAQRCLGLL